MKITILQTDIAWADTQANIRRVEKMMQHSGNADLFVLPEMWATGFCVEPEGIAEDEEQSVALAWMKNTARSKDCALSGSLAVRLNDGTYRNRNYFVTPDNTFCYDKYHLFRHGGEDTFFTPGNETVVAQWQGMRLLLLTCYDLRFPVFSRYGRNILTPIVSHLSPHTSHLSPLIYDAIVCVANWPAKRQTAWDTLIRARAIENQCCMVAVNRVGSDALCTYSGASAIIDPTGRTLAACDDTMTQASAHVEAADIARARNRFRVLADNDFLRT